MDYTFVSAYSRGDYMNIYDIAKRSGVSIATVSRVLNGSEKVSPKTREKVLKVMQQEEYTPNIFARGLGLNSIKMIGILCTDISDTFYAKAVSLVERLLRQNGFDALLCCTGNKLENKKKYLDILLKKRVDAVILIGSAFKENTDNSHIENAAKQIPVIIINGLVELPNTYCVLCDEQSAVSRNVQLLHKQGYDDILYLYDVLTYSGCIKISGYKDGLQKCNLPFQETLMVKVSKSIDDVTAKVTELLGAGLKFSAVMASEDLLAIGALKALQKFDLTMPVIGFNNSILAQCSSPALTTVDNMLDTLCPTAVQMLVDILENKTVPQKIVISSKLIERDTFHI
jgi:LacI family transcriptional regulator